MKIYLAGPEVFAPNAIELGVRKKALCQHYGFEGIFPLDNEITSSLSPVETGLLISRENERLIADSDLVIANLSPFRGASADVGTVYELGLARGLDKTIHGYSNDPELYQDRLLSLCGPSASQQAGSLCDRDGLKIEEFDLHDNLMIDGAIAAAGGYFVLAQKKADIFSMTTFEEVLIRLHRPGQPSNVDVEIG